MIDKEFKILVCGGRDYTNKERLYSFLDKVYEQLSHKNITIIHGGARGADYLAGEWASEKSVTIEVFYANWDTYKKAAGAIRNQVMLKEGKPDVVIAFKGGKGTKNMVDISKKAGIIVYEVKE